MSTSDSTARRSAEVPAMVAPYTSPLSTDPSRARERSVASVRVGPYVPAPWRGVPTVARAVPPSELPLPAFAPIDETPVAAAPATDPVVVAVVPTETAAPASAPRAAPTMPWIEAFLASTPALPMRAIEPPTLLVEADLEQTFVAALGDTGFLAPRAPAVPMPQPAPAEEDPSDEWALDEAAEQLESLAHELGRHEYPGDRASEAGGLFESEEVPAELQAALPAWSDDDLRDLMPIAPPSASVLSPVAVIEPWADRARRTGDDGAEAAARTLELLARRVRDGELSLTGYEPRLGDAAVLAAALAALLGVRST